MKVYNINFDCGRITYFEYNSLVQVYRFYSFYVTIFRINHNI